MDSSIVIKVIVKPIQFVADNIVSFRNLPFHLNVFSIIEKKHATSAGSLGIFDSHGVS
jgi:hypothetical protein